jgi:peptidoglycan-associated lipoprotein
MVRMVAHFHFRRVLVLGLFCLLCFSLKTYADEVLDVISFSRGGASLSAEAKAKLENVAAWAKANPDKRIQIQGHTDKRGSREDNMAMGERRAGKVKTFLISLGIAGDRMDAVSYGEEAPLIPGDTAEARAKNRRCTLVVLEP